MKKNMLPVIALASLLATACQETGGKVSMASANTSQKDQKLSAEKFAGKAYTGNMLEVRLGELAQEKAASSDVRQFAEMMVQDHSQANDELTPIMQNMNIQMPDSLPKDMQKTVDDLQSKSGLQFDRAYMDEMVNEHEKDIKLYEKAISQLENMELKNYAQNTMPVLRKHLEQAREINQMMQQPEAKK